MKKQILLLTAALVFTLVFCGAVSAADQSDLTITYMTHIASTNAYAGQNNSVMVMVKNSGSGTSPATKLKLYVSDVSSGTVPVASSSISSLTSGSTTQVTLIDPTFRSIKANTVYGSPSPSYVTYTAKVDPDNNVVESDENNNNKTTDSLPIYYNGYTGKHYQYNGVDVLSEDGINNNTGGDIKTQHTYYLRGGLVYYTQPASAYKGVGWTTRTETWNRTNLPIPSIGTVQDVWLYLSYNWDTTSGEKPNWTATFNGNDITNSYLAWYTDQANGGSYPTYKYGLMVFNVTNLFNKNGDNTLVITPNTGNSQAIYPSTLAVIYKDPNATLKQIFINEQCDELGASSSGAYANPLGNAIAYAPFTGMNISTGYINSAMLHSFAGSAGTDEGNLFFNGNVMANNFWQGTSNTAFAQIMDVKNSLLATGNVAGIQGTNSGGMVALQQFLVIEYNQVIASPTSGIFNNALNVTLGALDPDSIIYYTTDGTNPTNSSNVYTRAIHIDTNKVLKFISVGTDGVNSPIYTENYYISPKVDSVDPVNNAIINIKNKVIKITFNEDVKEGSAFENITVTGPSGLLNFTKSISANVLSLTLASDFADGSYIINLPINSLSDLVDNGLTFAFASNFKVDTTSPVVNSVDPVKNAIINIKNKSIKITFSEKIFAGSDYGNIRVTGPSGAVNFTKAISGNVLTLTQLSNFVNGVYSVNIPSNGIVDQAGNALTSVFASNFTVDITAPSVSSVDPKSNAITNIKNKVIKLVFSENIQAGSAYNGIKITGPSGAVNFTKSISGSYLTLTPTSNYSNGVYNISIPVNAIKDAAGNGLSAYSSKFTVDTLKPTAKASPAGGYYNKAKSVYLSMSESGVIYYTLNGTTPTTKSTKYNNKAFSISSSKTLRFLAVDKAGNLSLVYTQKYVIDKKAPTASATPGSGSYKNTVKVTLKMSENGTIYYTTSGATPSTKSTKYTKPFYLSTSKNLKYLAVDLASNKSTVYTKKYTIKDTTAPKVSSAQPANKATKVPVNQIITVTFSEPIKTGSAYNSITVKSSSGKSIVIKKSISSNVLTIKLAKGTYSKNTKYTLTIPAKALKDLMNNSLRTTYKTSFTTTKT